MNLNLNCYWIDRNYNPQDYLHDHDKWCWENCGNPIKHPNCIDAGAISLDHTHKSCNCRSDMGNKL